MSFKNSLLLRRSDELSGTAPAPRPEFAERGKLGKIVVAESEPADLDHIATILRNLNFTVLTAQDGKTALTLTRRHSPLLVLSALVLPQIDGYRLAQELRERKETESIPFMFIVGGGETPDRLIGHETSAHDYIQKPFSVPEFERRVMGLLNPVIRRRDKGAAVAGDAPPRGESLPKPVASGQTSGRTDETLEETLARMRRLLAELSDLLGFVERRRRLFTAMGDFVGREQAHRPASEDRDSEGGHLIRFQNSRGHGEHTGGPVPERPAEARRGTTSASADERTAAGIDTLEKYRAEYRELSDDAEEEPVSAAMAAPAPRDRYADGGGDTRAGAETGGKPSATADEPRRPDSSDDVPFDDLEEAFDSDLLVKLGVRIDEPAAAKIKEEEFTSFARQSFLSAFLDESERSGKLESLYDEAQDYVLRSIRRAAVGGNPYVARAEMLVGRLIDSLSKSDELLLRATEREPVFSVSSHSVNVAVLGIRISQIQGRNPQFHSRVGLAALFHEIGVVRLPEKLVFKEEPLTEEELNILRKRPLFSARALQESFGVVGEIAGQVFEREDGSGHPMGLRSGEIRDEAKIIGVADFFEACIHRRPYRERLTGYQALYELSRDGEFQQGVVRTLVRCVSLFPFNEILLLSTGEVARVSGINPANLARPRVQLLLDQDGNEIREHREVDLLEHRSIDIAEVLTPDGFAHRRTR
jgi:response regulator RpfG family c-di-GMP phosphodiesterase